MSADLYIYAIRPDEVDEWRRLSSIEIWTDDDRMPGDGDPTYGSDSEFRRYADMIDTFHETGRACWIGQVSWLKSWLSGDAGSYVPGMVDRVSELADEHRSRRINDAMIAAIMVAMNTPNRSIYRRRHVAVPRGWKVERCRGVAKRQDVRRWLNEHRGLTLGKCSE